MLTPAVADKTAGTEDLRTSFDRLEVGLGFDWCYCLGQGGPSTDYKVLAPRKGEPNFKPTRASSETQLISEESHRGSKSGRYQLKACGALLTDVNADGPEK